MRRPAARCAAAGRAGASRSSSRRSRSRASGARASGQQGFIFEDEDGVSTEEQEYNPTPIINEIRPARGVVARTSNNPADWGVTPATARLLTHWRSYNFRERPPVLLPGRGRRDDHLADRSRRRGTALRQILGAHPRARTKQANPELLRLAMKMATGSGKTTVMAMLIAWQTVNAVRSPTSSLFSRGFLIVTPGITIRDRLRVLLPRTRTTITAPANSCPPTCSATSARPRSSSPTTTPSSAARRWTCPRSAGAAAGPRRAAGDDRDRRADAAARLRRLLALKNVVVINDEAHHCYRHKVDARRRDDLKGEDKNEAKKNNEAARLWITGIEALKRKVGVRAVYDLSATPFFLRGSGYAEGTLFPWTVSDFSLMDAIECGIVKLPRVPVADNLPGTRHAGVPRSVGAHRQGDAEEGARQVRANSIRSTLPTELQTALYALYSHYAKTFEHWKRAGIDVPPVFIVVCNNTSTSKLVYEWISGWERASEDGETRATSITAIWNCSATTTSTATGCRARTRC